MTKNDFKIISEKLSRILRIGNKIQTNLEITNLTQNAINNIFNKYRHEPIITEKMINEFSREVAEA